MTAATEPRAWAPILARYRDPEFKRSLFEIIVTAGPLFLIWGVAAAAVKAGWWWGLLLAFPAALFLVRLFMIQHDCGHGAFFRSKTLNDWVGRLIGVLTLTPYDYWRKTHAIHHGTSGNLDRRELGAIEMMTVAEYQALPRWRRLLYRLYRNPIVLFVIGPAYMFVIQHRLPVGLMKNGLRPWISVMGNNAGVLVLAALSVWAFGWAAVLAVFLPTVLISASIGVWLFYVQHQFETTHWAREGEWDLHEAALLGSSYYDLPPVLRWFTANIGVHHVHHVNSRIPFYRLGDVLRDHPELKGVSRLTLWRSFRCVSLALWDEAGRRLVSFREAKAIGQAA